MKPSTLNATLGALLHDIGKLALRAGDTGTHSQLSRLMLSGVRRFARQELLDCAAYHHDAALRAAGLGADSPAYIVALADGISAAAEGTGEEGAGGQKWDRSLALESIFNHLHDRQGTGRIPLAGLREGSVYPQTGAVNPPQAYAHMRDRLLGLLADMDATEDWVSGVMSALEECTAYIPWRTAVGERADISLYDHAKTTAAIAACISEYLDAQGQTDLRAALLDGREAFCGSAAFLMFSADLSGIQSFLYTVATQRALRSLRSRSFFLEIYMEHVIDELLSRCGLSRVHLLYSGGGHCYVLLPNTRDVRCAVETVMGCVREDLMRQFGVRLYLAYAFTPCSANDLMNRPAQDAPYQAIYRRLSQALSRRKLMRYTAKELRQLNAADAGGDRRECKICGRADRLGSGDLCPWCQRFVDISPQVQRQDVFLITDVQDSRGMPLPSPDGTRYLCFSTQEDAAGRLKRGEVIRIYTKNNRYPELSRAVRLHVGDYHASNLLSELADSAQGIRRLAICRADVDNLGAAFVHGFEQRREGLTPQQRNRFVTLSRTAALSRQLSFFFKGEINRLLAGEGGAPALSVSVVYSGGDDVFLVGAWDDVIRAMMRIQRAFERFSGGALSISAGIGLYPQTYPIRRAAVETEDLVAEAKGLEGKNGVALFAAGQGHAYHWETFVRGVLGEKLASLRAFFGAQQVPQDDARGMAFLYRLLALLRESDGIYAARLAYLLARLAPPRNQAEARAAYDAFAKKMMAWYRRAEDRAQLITAIFLYVYERRGETA